MQSLEMVQNVVVDEVIAWSFEEQRLLQFVWEWNAQPGERNMALIPDRYRRFAISVHDDTAIVVDGGNSLIPAVVLGPPGYIRGVTIGKHRRHNQLLLCARL